MTVKSRSKVEQGKCDREREKKRKRMASKEYIKCLVQNTVVSQHLTVEWKHTCGITMNVGLNRQVVEFTKLSLIKFNLKYIKLNIRILVLQSFNCPNSKSSCELLI